MKQDYNECLVLFLPTTLFSILTSVVSLCIAEEDSSLGTDDTGDEETEIDSLVCSQEAIAIKFAENNYNVILNYNKSEKQAKQIKKELEEQGKNIEICKADVSKREEVKKLVKFTLNKFGNID